MPGTRSQTQQSMLTVDPLQAWITVAAAANAAVMQALRQTSATYTSFAVMTVVPGWLLFQHRDTIINMLGAKLTYGVGAVLSNSRRLTSFVSTTRHIHILPLINPPLRGASTPLTPPVAAASVPFRGITIS